MYRALVRVSVGKPKVLGPKDCSEIFLNLHGQGRGNVHILSRMALDNHVMLLLTGEVPERPGQVSWFTLKTCFRNIGKQKSLSGLVGTFKWLCLERGLTFKLNWSQLKFGQRSP